MQWMVTALSPEHAVALVTQGRGMLIDLGSEHAGQALPAAALPSPSLCPPPSALASPVLWGVVGLAVGGAIGSALAWQLCTTMAIGKLVGTQLHHLLPILAAA